MIFDITLTISPEMPVWPGDPAVKVERISKMEEGAEANVSQINMCVHTGTHLDAPLHFIPGQKSVEQLDLNTLIGPAYVILIPQDCSVITSAVLEQAGIPTGANRLLFKTHNSTCWANQNSQFHPDFVGIDLSGAEYLIQLGARLVGVDYLSVAPFSDSGPTHIALLKSNIVILEGLNLSQINPGWYQLVCLPLKIERGDGAPARAVLIQE